MSHGPRDLGRPLAPGWISRTQQAIALGLGLLSLLAWLIPIAGLSISTIGLILAFAARSAERRPGKTRFAIVLCLIGLALSLLAFYFEISILTPLSPAPAPEV
ncbi:hypothetical protein BH23PLA1_BH23PLA1_36150 [soil metagenome]